MCKYVIKILSITNLLLIIFNNVKYNFIMRLKIIDNRNCILLSIRLLFDWGSEYLESTFEEYTRAIERGQRWGTSEIRDRSFDKCIVKISIYRGRERKIKARSIFLRTEEEANFWFCDQDTSEYIAKKSYLWRCYIYKIESLKEKVNKKI